MGTLKSTISGNDERIKALESDKAELEKRVPTTPPSSSRRVRVHATPNTLEYIEKLEKLVSELKAQELALNEEREEQNSIYTNPTVSRRLDLSETNERETLSINENPYGLEGASGKRSEFLEFSDENAFSLSYAHILHNATCKGLWLLAVPDIVEREFLTASRNAYDLERGSHHNKGVVVSKPSDELSDVNIRRYGACKSIWPSHEF